MAARRKQPFTGDKARCDKCGGTDISALYEGWVSGKMRRDCATCGNYWHESPLDAKPSSTSTRPRLAAKPAPAPTATKTMNTRKESPPVSESTTIQCPTCGKHSCQASLQKLAGGKEHLKASCPCGYAVNNVQDVPAPSARSSTTPTTPKSAATAAKTTKPTTRRTTAPKSPTARGGLSQDEKDVCAKLGISEESYRRERDGDTAQDEAAAQLDAAELEVCKNLRVSPADYLRTKREDQAKRAANAA